jgi:transcriptional antiterminator
MKERQKKLLRLLLANEGFLRIDDLASAFFVGKRTISRDLDSIESWLSMRGSMLERKQSNGIRLLSFGRTNLELLTLLNSTNTFFESLPAYTRGLLIHLFLIFHNREVKISELSQAFFISDTTAWNDLNNLECLYFSSHEVSLIRSRGVGIRLVGEESVLRLQFLNCLTELVKSETIIPYLYPLRESESTTLEVNQFKLLLKKINFPDDVSAVMELVKFAEEELGYQFIMASEALIYFYLQLAMHRIKSGALIHKLSTRYPVNKFSQVGKTLLDSLVGRVVSGPIPQDEFLLLGRLLEVQEIGEFKNTTVSTALEEISEDIRGFLDVIINDFGSIDQQVYYLDDQLQTQLGKSVSSLVLRIQSSIPVFHGKWGAGASEINNYDKKLAVLSNRFYQWFRLEVDELDLANLLINFQAQVCARTLPTKRRIRCLVCCFEGMGLASYLQFILKREFPDLDIVEATAVYKINEEYLASKKLDLILSTFQVSTDKTPVIHISLPLNKEKLQKEVAWQVAAISHTNSFHTEPIEKTEEEPFPDLWDFVNRFSFLKMPSKSEMPISQVMEFVSEQLLEDAHSRRLLASDFQKREELGELYFEEYGTRVLHCKSSAVSKPYAGVVEYSHDNVCRSLFLVAPNPCPNAVRLMLSGITTAFLDNSAFRQAILRGTLNDIRWALLDVYRVMSEANN